MLDIYTEPDRQRLRARPLPTATLAAAMATRFGATPAIATTAHGRLDVVWV